MIRKTLSAIGWSGILFLSIASKAGATETKHEAKDTRSCKTVWVEAKDDAKQTVYVISKVCK